MQKYDVAAYIWPAYTGKEPRTKMFWPEGMGEWETVRAAKPKFEGHLWPRRPLWGYTEEADPAVMEMQINEALRHGVNVFIYDWYWYDQRPFLEQCLNEGFLKARNNQDMKFYLMWANHDANYSWDRRISFCKQRHTTIWRGTTDVHNYKKIAKHWFEDYFTRPNYYKIDNKPLISIYELNCFINTCGGVEKTAEMMTWLNDEAKQYGLEGVHFQLIYYSSKHTLNLSGVDGGQVVADEIIAKLPFDSITHYQYCHFTDVGRDYEEAMVDVRAEWKNISDKFDIPYFPHVSVGWDCNPRFAPLRPNILTNNTPEAFEQALRDAKAFADKKGVNMITINSWNEWTEGSYLQPDDLYGYGYLEAVKKVFKE